jgi:hypothetical protein
MTVLTEQLIRAFAALGFEDGRAELSGEEEPDWAFAEILADAFGIWCDHRHDVVEQVERLALAVNAALSRARGDMGRSAPAGGVASLLPSARGARQIAVDVDASALEIREGRECRRYDLGRLGEEAIEEAFGRLTATVGADVVVAALVAYDDTDAHGFAVLTAGELAACRDFLGEQTGAVFRPLLGPALPERERVACEELVVSAPARPASVVRSRSAAPVPDRELAHGYRVERGKVLNHYDDVVRRADPATYCPISYEWAVDAEHVFFLGTLVDGLEARTFRPIDCDFGRDDARVAYAGTVLDVDPGSFEILTGRRVGEGRWAKDAARVLWFEDLDSAPRLMRGADAASFEAVAGEFARDRTTVYCAGHKLPGARPASWELLPGRRHSRDGKKAYYAYYRIKGADGETLEPFIDYLARDRQGFISHAERADPASVRKTLRDLFVFEGVLLDCPPGDPDDSLATLTVRVDRWVQQPRPGRNVPAAGDTHTANHHRPDFPLARLVGQPRYWLYQPTTHPRLFTLLTAMNANDWEFGEPQNWPLVERWLEIGRTTV